MEDFGGSDVTDVLNLLPLIDSLAFTNSEKIAMIGFSRGGMMTYIALAETDRIGAAAVYGGITDLFQFYSEHEQGMDDIIGLIGGTPEQKPEEYLKRSVYYWPEKIETPLLILHGEEDATVNISQARKLAVELDELGKTYELVTYPEGSHSLSEVAADRDNRIEQWFAKYLQLQ
ncbi:MAG: prolyl oligopeptidase family serine peptidase [Dehalococcoidia bacterium]